MTEWNNSKGYTNLGKAIVVELDELKDSGESGARGGRIVALLTAIPGTRGQFNSNFCTSLATITRNNSPLESANARLPSRQ